MSCITIKPAIIKAQRIIASAHTVTQSDVLHVQLILEETLTSLEDKLSRKLQVC